MHEQGAGYPGDDTGDDERGELGANHADREALSGTLIFANGDDHPSGPRSADAPQCHVYESEHDDRVGVIAGGRVDADASEQGGSFDPLRRPREPPEEAVVEQPVLTCQGEGEGCDGQVKAAQPQGRQADQEGRRTAGDTSQQEGESQVGVPPRCGRGAHCGADPHQCHLPERDLPGPSGEHHQRHGDDREAHQRTGLDDDADTDEAGQYHHTEHPERDQGDLQSRHPPVGRQVGRQGPHLLGPPPAARGVVVSPQAARPLSQEGQEHRRRHDRVCQTR